MKIKSFALISLLAVSVFSFVWPQMATSSEKELMKELALYKDNLQRAKQIMMGPPGVDALRSGKYLKRVTENINDFRKGDLDAFCVLVPLNSAHHYVIGEISTIRGTESSYEYLLHNPKSRNAIYGETNSKLPIFKPNGGRIEYLLLLKRRMESGWVSNSSKSVSTQVIFTYHPK